MTNLKLNSFQKDTQTGIQDYCPIAPSQKITNRKLTL